MYTHKKTSWMPVMFQSAVYVLLSKYLSARVRHFSTAHLFVEVIYIANKGGNLDQRTFGLDSTLLYTLHTCEQMFFIERHQ